MDPSKALADALNDAKKKAGTSRGTKEKGGKSSVAGALADFQKSAGGAGELEYADLLPREPFRAGQRKA